MSDILSVNKTAEVFFETVKSVFPKDVFITCSQWAKENRFLNSKVSSRPGRFSFDNAPYCMEICDCFSKSNSIQEIAIMKGVQLGLTTSVIENVIGYSIDVDPSPMMFVFPNENECKNYKKTKIDNLIDNSGLREKISAETDNRNTRRTGDTATFVEFSGGTLRLASAGNPTQLRSQGIKKLFLDELDGYVERIKNEGSPVEIATKRTDSFILAGRKICYNSTPLLAHKSKILEYFKKGDQRKFFVPCPHCGEMQELIFYKSDGGSYPDNKAIIKENTKTKPYGLLFNKEECKEGNYTSVRYRCQYCGEEFKDYHKQKIELKGEWRPTAKAKKPDFRSYHISALYSLTKPWKEIVYDFLNAGLDPKKLQTFYNLDLGEPFEDRTGGVEYQLVHRLKDMDAENNIVPEEALILTCAADVQRNRIECEIKAWGDRFRCWGIDHRVFIGNTSDMYDSCWQKFASIKNEVFAGNKKISLILVDSGDGELTDVVYNFCRTFGDEVIYPLKGLASTIRTTEKYKCKNLENYGGLTLFEIYVDAYKNQLARCFSQEERIDGTYPDYWFTFARGYSDEYFRQLTTEQRVKEKTSTGGVRLKWVQHGRNEAFDLNVYNFAAVEHIIFVYTNMILQSLYGSQFRELQPADPNLVFKYLKGELSFQHAGNQQN